jgi:hypothetical protein
MLLEAFMSLMCVLFLETLSIRCGASRDVHSRSSLSFTKAAHFSAWSNVNDVNVHPALARNPPHRDEIQI